ncbi:MAG: hypothetical protein ACI39G_05830 [Pseudoramibacter sp.]
MEKMTRKIIEQWNLPQNTACLTLDDDRPLAEYYSYIIDGEPFEALMLYDVKRNIIAVKTDKNLVGKIVEFV